MSSIDRRTRLVLIGLVVIAAGLRMVVRLAGGEEGFLRDGYGFNLAIVDNFLAGDGLCFAPEVRCADRPPMYPLFLAPFVRTGLLYPGVVIAQAAMGAVMVWLAWWLGRELFSGRAGLLAAAATALNPYAVVHDTALQDTVLLNLFMLAGVACLLKACKADTRVWWLASGVVLGAAVLTAARVAPIVPCAMAWVAIAIRGDWRPRARRVALISIPVVLLVGGWMVRNWRLTGVPVLTAEAGERLWFGNNPLTFVHFPQRSIDLIADEVAALPAEQQAMLEADAPRLVRDARMRASAIDYIVSDPTRAATGAARKVWVAASAELSPARGPVTQAGYRLVFLPVHILAAIVMWRARSDWRRHGLAWLVVGSFALTTAIYYAHTSHKSYLDAILFVYAAALL